MPTENFARMPADRRRRLVRTAAAEFASVGYEQASLNKIIKTCGMSKSSFYHVFSAKQDLFDLVVTDLLGELGTTIDIPPPEAFGDGRFWTTAGTVWEAILASATDEALLSLGRMFHLRNTPEAARDAVTETLDVVRRWLIDVLAQGRATGQVRTDLPLSLQGDLVFAILQAFDAWTLARTDARTDPAPSDLSPSEMSDLVAAQWATLRRALAN